MDILSNRHNLLLDGFFVPDLMHLLLNLFNILNLGKISKETLKIERKAEGHGIHILEKV